MMRRFIKNILIFLFGLIIYFLIILIINSIIIYIISDNVHKSNILIVGDSHAAHALNPDLFSSALNLSQGAEPYIITYWKLKATLDDIDPDTLIIGFNHYNISGVNDLKFCDDRWSSKMFGRSYLIEDLGSIRNLIKIDYLQYYNVIFRNLFLFPHTEHFNYIGRYKESDNGSYISNSKERILRHYYISDSNQADVSTVNVAFLDSIIKICFARDIVPVLVEVPVHMSYYNKIPSEYKSSYDDLFLELKKNNNIMIVRSDSLDYNDERFLDSDHLNKLGSDYFTRYFLDCLKSNKD